MSKLYYGSKIECTRIIKNDYPGFEIVNSDNPEKIANSYSPFFDNNKIFLHSNCNNDQLKIVADLIDNKNGTHFLYYDDENFDGRSSLIQKIKKSNQIFNLLFPVYGDESALKRSIFNYAKTNKIKIENDCCNWLINNCPLVRYKSKTDKKEIIYYDLDLLNKEFEKISSIKNELITEDFENSNFNSDADIFMLFDYMIKGDIFNSYSLWNRITTRMDDQAVLIIFIHHIMYILELTGLRNKTTNIKEIIDRLEFRDIIGKYYNDEWTLSQNFKSQNPLRVKIECNKDLLNVEKITAKFQISIESLINLRNNLNKELSIFLFLTKVCNV